MVWNTSLHNLKNFFYCASSLPLTTFAGEEGIADLVQSKLSLQPLV